MATRLKTVQYAFTPLATLVNNTLTNIPQLTVYLPETGTKTFRSVIAKVTCDDIVTATGGTVNSRITNLRLGAAAYTSVSNANTVTHSAENMSHLFTSDFTSHFSSNWSGTSMTCDVQVSLNQSTGTTLGMTNVCVTLDITYEYDDTSTTQLKTVWIPLNAPTGALGTAKPAALDTIPALDTYLPEASKAYRNISIVVQGNEARAGATTDHTMTFQIDTLTAHTTANYEGALATDRWIRYVWDITSLGMSTNATHGFYLWASVARVNHPQIWMMVTYEFNASTTTSAMQSLLLPMEFPSPMGGTAATDQQRAKRELWVQEPGTITLQRLSLYLHWDQVGAITGVNIRVGTGSFVTYTDTAAVLAGGNGCMVRNDAITLTRGRNTLQADMYRTDSNDIGSNTSAFWIVNYTSSAIHSDGIGAHNKTVIWNITAVGTSGATNLMTSASKALIIPETNYFMTGLGCRFEYASSSTVSPAGVSILAERTSAEGGVMWESAYTDIGETDPEAGVRTAYGQIRSLFRRWTGDPDVGRMDIQTARRWRTVISNNCSAYHTLDLMMTYHTMTYPVADNIAGFAGGVDISLHRSDSNTSMPGEIVMTTSRGGDGPFAFTWYDDTEPLYVSVSDGTNVGRSTDSYAG